MTDLVHVKGLSELETYFDQLPGKVLRNVARGGVRAGCAVILPIAVAHIRFRSGRTARSLKIGTRVVGDRVIGRIYTRSPVARWLEYGTKPHTITARHLKALSFGGLFFQSIEHPGVQPRSFMRNAADVEAQAAVVAVGRYMRDRMATKSGLDTAGILIEGDEA